MNAPASPPAFEHFTLPGRIRLGLNANRKLKTIIVKLYLAADLDASVTQRSLLPMVLRRGSRRLTDMQALSRYLGNLYGAGLWSSVVKVGEWHVTKFRLEVVNDLFLPHREKLFRRGLEFLRDLVFDPLEVDGGLKPEYVEQEKETLRLTIESILDDKAAYATFRCIEEMCRGEPYRLSEHGRVEDLSGIGPDNLYASYRQWLNESPMAIYVAGDIDIGACRNEVEDVFQLQRSGDRSLAPVPSPVPVGDTRELRERLDVQQGRLVLGFRHGVTQADDAYEALLVMNGVLGAFSHSKLFQNVREKASMAYSATSWLENTKGLLFIGCGIDVDKYEDALRIILEQVDAMKNGDIADEEVESTVKTILNQNLMLEDNFSALADVDYFWGLHGRPMDLADFRRKLRRVRRDDLVDVARRLRKDTVYFLHS